MCYRGGLLRPEGSQFNPQTSSMNLKRRHLTVPHFHHWGPLEQGAKPRTAPVEHLIGHRSDWD